MTTSEPTIEEDIRSWSREVLEVPNPYLPNNLPACPYAKKGWLDNRVKVIEVDDLLSSVYKHVKTFHQNEYDLLILASFNLPKSTLLWEITEILNDVYSKHDIHVMVFHPDYAVEDTGMDFLADHEWESGIEQDYCMAFIQGLKQVDEASRKLEKLGYYEAYPEEDYKTLVIERRRRLEQWQ
jgi:hypothetical protein